MSAAPRLRVGVVDDHAVFADALALAINTSELLSCIGTASNLDGALALAAKTDVVVMDVGLGVEDGIVATQRLHERYPSTRVLVLTGQHPTPTLVLNAFDAGASGLLAKDTSLRLVVDTIAALREETFVIDRQIARTLLPALHSMATSADATPAGSLTAREHQILELLASGRDIQTASTMLGIKVHTGRGYVKSLLAKLGAHSQLEAVALARAAGLLDEPS